MNGTTTTESSNRTCYCGGKVFRETEPSRHGCRTRFACHGCGAATRWFLTHPSGAEISELLYHWDLVQAAKAEEMFEAGFMSADELPLLKEG
jgi:hypothetical protein